MAKMFYTTEEAAAKLNVSPDGLKQYVTDNKLREFRDGARVMFKVDQVDRLADSKPGSNADSGIELSLADAAPSDAISLADSGVHRAPAKEDTVVTGGGKSRSGGVPVASASATGIPMAGSTAPGLPGQPSQKVFESGEMKSAADSHAQTQIQPAVEDQLSLEGVGSGSGLLDLTRESDDTSLGAELLDEIYPGTDQKQDGGIGSASGIFEQPVSPEGSSIGAMALETGTPAGGAVAGYDVLEEPDPTSGAFGGMALAGSLVMGLTTVITAGYFTGFIPDWVGTITSNTMNLGLFVGILAVVAALFALVGYFAGKASAR